MPGSMTEASVKSKLMHGLMYKSILAFHVRLGVKVRFYISPYITSKAILAGLPTLVSRRRRHGLPGRLGKAACPWRQTR
jgi:hypothetical protein